MLNLRFILQTCFFCILKNLWVCQWGSMRTILRKDHTFKKERKKQQIGKLWNGNRLRFFQYFLSYFNYVSFSHQFMCFILPVLNWCYIHGKNISDDLRSSFVVLLTDNVISQNKNLKFFQRKSIRTTTKKQRTDKRKRKEQQIWGLCSWNRLQYLLSSQI